jgi:hypothetical protein
MFYTETVNERHTRRVSGATEDRSEDQDLAAGCHSAAESLQESAIAIAIEQSTQRAFPTLHEDDVRRRLGKAFGDGTGDRGIIQQLLLGGKRTLNEALRQTLGLEVVKLTVGSSVRLRKTSDRTF